MLAVVTLVLGGFAACAAPGQCVRISDCDDSYTCDQGQCRPVDEPRSSETVDASRPDVAVRDAASSDAASDASGASDASNDARPSDASSD